MADAMPDLKPPVLLVAMPQVLDPFFHKSVVLLIHHSDEGSFGFIANRPTEIRVSEILQGMNIGWEGPGGTLAYFGGPVQPQLGSVLFAAEDGEPPGLEAPDQTTSEVLPGLHVTQHVGDLSALAGAPPARFRLYLGYAGWGEGQLVTEITRNDWLLAPVNEAIVFAGDPGTAWAEALESVGVDPHSLPSWTPAASEESAN